MIFTKKFVLIEGMIAITLFLLSYSIDVVSLFVLLNIILIIAYVIDYVISSTIADLSIERVGRDKLSIYEEEKIEFSLENKIKTDLFIELKGEKLKPYFTCENSYMSGKLKGRERRIFQYVVVPQKRGAYKFSNLSIRITGKLGLCKKQYNIVMEREYKVYPNLKDMKRYRIMAMNNKNFKGGKRPLRILGQGREFDSLREYVCGDEYRKINWKATARENKPIMNQYDIEKNQNIYIMIDCGRPMSYTIGGYNKLELALNSGLLLVDIANSKGDKTGVLTFNKSVESFVQAGKGSSHRNKIMDTLYHIEATRDTSNYEEAFLFMKNKEKRRSLIVIYTDFNTLQEGEYMLKRLSILAKRNIVMVITMKDEKLHSFKDMKAKSNKDIFTKGTALEFLKEREGIIKKLNSRGIICMECEVDSINLDVINRYIQIKNRGML